VNPAHRIDPTEELPGLTTHPSSCCSLETHHVKVLYVDSDIQFQKPKEI
jgi:hypothetical protein